MGMANLSSFIIGPDQSNIILMMSTTAARWRHSPHPTVWKNLNGASELKMLTVILEWR